MLRRRAAILAGAALLGAAPADPLLARLLAAANAVPAAALRYDRATISSETSNGSTERHERLERWDGRVWTLVSVDGRAPTAKAAADAAKAALNAGVPGYYRLGQYLAAGPVRASDAEGRVVYRLATLPPGSVAVRGAPGDKFSAELTVDTTGPVPFIRRARYFAPAPFRLFMVARLDRFEATADYKVNAAGRPELVHQTVDLAGALFGRDGNQHSDSNFTYR